MRILPPLLYRPLLPLLPFAVVAVLALWGDDLVDWSTGLPFHAVAEHWNTIRLALLLAIAGVGNLLRLALRAARRRDSVPD
ncbi:hypothetical protein ACVU7I_08790 [Patulibacter sp. S7RM1-6]